MNNSNQQKPEGLVTTMKGIQDILEVYEDKVVITPKGLLGMMNKGVKGSKTIPYRNITAIQFKKSGMLSGYLQFTVPGGNESRRGILDATKDENTFMFTGDNAKAEKIKLYIEKRIEEIASGKSTQVTQSTASITEELSKLADLKEKGILTEEEFIQAKNKLLNQ